MRITRACDYTLRALTYMARKPKDSVFMRADLATKISVPNSFLGKILQNLAKSDILISERGKKGGFKLGKDPKDINVYDIIIAIDGPIYINNCMDPTYQCEVTTPCTAMPMWHEIQDTLVDKLKTFSLSDIAEDK